MTNRKSPAIRGFEDIQNDEPALPLVLLLRQLSGVIADLSDAQYSTKPVGVVESSIGSHLRHCLDHVVALLEASQTGRLDYDNRRRGTPIETSRFAAIDLIGSLEAQLADLSPDDLDREVVLLVALAAGSEPVRVQSSIGRELAYVVSHTIHHNALVGAIVKTLGGRLPDRFGYAPSTVAYLEREHACAPSA